MPKEKNITHKIELNDNELILLDGKVGSEAQEMVNEAKSRVSFKTKYPDFTQRQTDFIANVINVAQSEKRLSFYDHQFTYCSICNKGTIFGRQKKTFHGKELQNSHVTFKGVPTLGGCTRCINSVLPALKEELKTVRAELPPILSSTEYPYQRFNKANCTKCRWKGNETELLEVGGRSGCPKCGTHNAPFSDDVIKIHYNEFVVLIKDSTLEVKKLIKIKQVA